MGGFGLRLWKRGAQVSEEQDDEADSKQTQGKPLGE